MVYTLQLIGVCEGPTFIFYTTLKRAILSFHSWHTPAGTEDVYDYRNYSVDRGSFGARRRVLCERPCGDDGSPGDLGLPIKTNQNVMARNEAISTRANQRTCYFQLTGQPNAGLFCIAFRWMPYVEVASFLAMTGRLITFWKNILWVNFPSPQGLSQI